MVHLALQEGAIDVDLLLDLPVGVIEILGEKGDSVTVEDRVCAVDGIAERCAARVAASTAFDFPM